MTWFNLARIGLIYDIAGAIALAWGFLVIGPREFQQAKLFWQEDPGTEKLAYAKVDSIFGVVLIVLGFIGQLLGSDNGINDYFMYAGKIFPIAALLVLALAMIVFAFCRGSFAQGVVRCATSKDGNL